MPRPAPPTTGATIPAPRSNPELETITRTARAVDNAQRDVTAATRLLHTAHEALAVARARHVDAEHAAAAAGHRPQAVRSAAERAATLQPEQSTGWAWSASARARSARRGFVVGQARERIEDGPALEIVLARARAEVAALDFERLLVALVRSGRMLQRDMSAVLGIGQSPMSQMVRRIERRSPEPSAGFSGATPYEIAQRYAVGMLSCPDLIDELSRWPYEPRPSVAGVAPDVGAAGGSLDDVDHAYLDGLISKAQHRAVLEVAQDR